MKLLSRFFLCVGFVYVCSSVMQSAVVLIRLENAGAELSVFNWLQAIVHDLWGLTWEGYLKDYYISYGLHLTVGFAVAMGAAFFASKYLPLPTWLVYTVAGGTAMVTLLVTTNKVIFDIPFYAGTRGTLPFALQVIAGLAGGALFFRLAVLRVQKSGEK